MGIRTCAKRYLRLLTAQHYIITLICKLLQLRSKTVYRKQHIPYMPIVFIPFDHLGFFLQRFYDVDPDRAFPEFALADKQIAAFSIGRHYVDLIVSAVPPAPHLIKCVRPDICKIPYLLTADLLINEADMVVDKILFQLAHDNGLIARLNIAPVGINKAEPEL